MRKGDGGGVSNVVDSDGAPMNPPVTLGGGCRDIPFSQSVSRS